MVTKAVVDWNTVIPTDGLYVDLAYKDDPDQGVVGGFAIRRGSNPATIRDIALIAWFIRYKETSNPNELLEIDSYEADKQRIKFRHK